MGPATLWSVHFISEAGRLAYADRGVYMADPDFYAPPAGLLDHDYLAERSTIDPYRLQPGPRESPGCRRIVRPPRRVALGRDAAFEFPSTSHICIVDATATPLR